MNEKIKEILNEIKIVIDYNEIQNIYRTADLDYNDGKLLLNYITNLQKENEQLRTEQNTYINTIKEVNKECNNLFNHLTKKDLDYKQRNEKAVEYINNLRDESAEREGFYNCFPDDLYIANIENLLNILQGGDE